MTGAEYKKSESIPKNRTDLTGTKFGRLLVVSIAYTNKYGHYFKCKCDCGNEKTVRGMSLIVGDTRSCKCYNKDVLKKHGACFGKKTKEYNVWVGMRKRCFNKNEKCYHRYGGRGIGVCLEWNDFEVFLKDVGLCPGNGYSLERIDNNKGYSKENCRWATCKEQNNNRRSNKLLTHNGKTKNMTQWAEETGLAFSTIAGRISRGWTHEKTLVTPKLR